MIHSLTNAQTIKQIDSLRNYTRENLDQYDCIEYSNERILNDDAMAHYTVEFYHDKKGMLVYMNWKTRTHTFHIMGDDIGMIELLLIDGKVVYRVDFGYSYDNPQWHKEVNQLKVKVTAIEAIREYYQEDGLSLGEFKSREAQGEFKDRFTLLDSIPLELKLKRRWSDRCDECLEKDYLNLFRRLWKEQNPE